MIRRDILDNPDETRESERRMAQGQERSSLGDTAPVLRHAPHRREGLVKRRWLVLYVLFLVVVAAGVLKAAAVRDRQMMERYANE